MDIISRTAIVNGQSKDIGDYALVAARNELLAAGGTVIGADINILIPDYAYKSRMNTMKKKVLQTCREQAIPVSHMMTEKTNAVSSSMAIIHMVGVKDQEKHTNRIPVAAGQSIILTKWIGMEGMLRMVEEQKDEVEKRFSSSFINQMRSFKENLWDMSELAFIEKKKHAVLRQVAKGGILAALWDLAKDYKTGLDIELKEIPIRQETIEVCEYFRLNPYQLSSASCFLMVAQEGEVLVQEMAEQGIYASVIGKLTDSNDKIIRNGAEIRYIDRPAPDEIHKLGI